MFPDTDAIKILREKFDAWEPETLLDRWVSDAVGVDDRVDVLGRAAIRRAANNLHVDFVVDRSLSFDGELRLIDSRKVVYLREGIARSRRGFTLAHELAHASLFEIEPALNQQGQRVERLCDMFAAELVLPASSVRSGVAAEVSHVRALLILAAKSNASLSSTCVRFTECFGGSAGIISKEGRVMRKYGHVPSSLDLSEHFAHIALARDGLFRSYRLSRHWMLETAYLGSKYVYVLRQPESTRC